jgi:hypothetical protein
MDLNEMEQSLAKCKEKIKNVDVVVVDEFPDDEETMVQDVYDSMSLLTQCMHLLDYISDKELCPAVSKRERDSMARLSDKVRVFLDNMNVAYNDSEEEE